MGQTQCKNVSREPFEKKKNKREEEKNKLKEKCDKILIDEVLDEFIKLHNEFRNKYTTTGQCKEVGKDTSWLNKFKLITKDSDSVAYQCNMIEKGVLENKKNQQKALNTRAQKYVKFLSDFESDIFSNNANIDEIKEKLWHAGSVRWYEKLKTSTQKKRTDLCKEYLGSHLPVVINLDEEGCIQKKINNSTLLLDKEGNNLPPSGGHFYSEKCYSYALASVYSVDGRCPANGNKNHQSCPYIIWPYKKKLPTKDEWDRELNDIIKEWENNHKDPCGRQVMQGPLAKTAQEAYRKCPLSGQGDDYYEDFATQKYCKKIVAEKGSDNIFKVCDGLLICRKSK